MLKVSIVGIFGYTGEELLKLLLKHPQVQITDLYDKTEKEIPINEIYPHIQNKLICRKLDVEKLKKSDVVFLALPHGISMEIVSKIYNSATKIIDLSADFRIKNEKTYETWYEKKHICPQLLKEAIYGLTELNRQKIKKAKLVANPGCYPTSILLACIPIFKEKIVENVVIVDSKSGYSGGGREFAKEFKTSPTFKPYKIGYSHRHIPEIEQEISQVINEEVKLIFSPNVFNSERGIISTIYLKLKDKITTLDTVYNILMEFYSNEPFIKIQKPENLPSLQDVIFKNTCEIGFVIEKKSKYLIVVSAIDNLLKGASGQAIQNMNLMFSIDETLALPR